MKALVSGRDACEWILDGPGIRSRFYTAVRLIYAHINAEIARRIPQGPVFLNFYDEASIAAWLRQAAFLTKIEEARG